MNQWNAIVIGGGPAGLLAACRAGERGRRVLLVEKNRRPGAKILMSGGGHCNLTHATDARGIVAAFGPSGRFLHSALAALGPQDLVDLIEAEGVATRVEPDGKILPASGKAADVLGALLRRLRRSGAALAAGESVEELHRHGDGFRLVTARRTLAAPVVVLTTGGQSYPGCGTTGDGYRLAAALGHTIIPPRPALVPILVDAEWTRALQGITVPDVRLTVIAPDGEGDRPVLPTGASGESPGGLPAGAKSAKVLLEARGSMLFAHFGLSGPVALDVSRAVSALPRGRRPPVRCDFLPGVTATQLDAALAGATAESGRRLVASLLERWLPRRLAEALVALAPMPADRRAAEFSRAERQRLVAAVKQLEIHTTGTLGFEKAEVTAGGVALGEIDSHTMQSTRAPGLFIAGELLDVDGPIGGYNLQAAFSTGYLAGESA